MKKASTNPPDNNENSSTALANKPSETKEAELKKSTKTAATKEKSPKEKKSTKTSKYSLMVSLSLIVALLAIGLAGYDFWLLWQQKPVNSQLADSQSTLDLRLNQLEQQVVKTNNRLSLEEQARDAAHLERQAINLSLQSITEKLGRNTVAWRMAEVEYLLTVANHRLTLAHDRETAITIFETADSKLKVIADPSLINVRKKIASELVALNAVPDVDITGLAVKLGSLAETVEQLPLRDKKRVAVATEAETSSDPVGWQELPAAIWNDIKSLVKVRRHQQPTEPLLPPKQAWFLYQNLQLKLEQARLAVLQKNTLLFRQSLKEVSDWLSGYFEYESTAVVNIQATVKNLSSIELQPSIPDVSGSLRELRAAMKARPQTITQSKNVPSNDIESPIAKPQVTKQ